MHPFTTKSSNDLAITLFSPNRADRSYSQFISPHRGCYVRLLSKLHVFLVIPVLRIREIGASEICRDGIGWMAAKRATAQGRAGLHGGQALCAELVMAASRHVDVGVVSVANLTEDPILAARII
jgi:hypothetical protein